jgi:protection of telomeres protein 1
MTSSNVKQQTAPAAPVIKKRDRFSLIKNLSMDTFVDLTVHVVKTWYQDDRVHLYVTDYTVNKSLFDYQEKSNDDEEGGTFGDEFGFMTRNTREKRTWQGPMGRMTVQITLWDPHSTYAREHVHEDSYVALSNVRVKTDKMNGIMEGVIHTDKMYPHKLGIRLLEDDDEDSQFDELKNRKREYWRQNKMNKRKVTEDFGENDGPRKNAKKRRKERLKTQQEQRQKQQQQQRKEEGQTEIPVTMLPTKGPNPHSMHSLFSFFEVFSLLTSPSSSQSSCNSMPKALRNPHKREPQHIPTWQHPISTPLPEREIPHHRASSRFLPA